MSSNSSNEAGLSGALSLLKIGAGEINDEENEVTDNNNINTTTILLCAKCGKEGGEDSMNTCNKCDLVVYCNAACKKKHRSITRYQRLIPRFALHLILTFLVLP